MVARSVTTPDQAAFGLALMLVDPREITAELSPFTPISIEMTELTDLLVTLDELEISRDKNVHLHNLRPRQVNPSKWGMLRSELSIGAYIGYTMVNSAVSPSQADERKVAWQIGRMRSQVLWDITKSGRLRGQERLLSGVIRSYGWSGLRLAGITLGELPHAECIQPASRRAVSLGAGIAITAAIKALQE